MSVSVKCELGPFGAPVDAEEPPAALRLDFLVDYEMLRLAGHLQNEVPNVYVSRGALNSIEAGQAACALAVDMKLHQHMLTAILVDSAAAGDRPRLDVALVRGFSVRLEPGTQQLGRTLVFLDQRERFVKKLAFA